jgi:uncharacterized protein
MHFLEGCIISNAHIQILGQRIKREISMKNKLINDVAGAKVFVLVYEPDETFQEPLVSFAAKQHLGAGHFTAIGAFRRATLGYFDRELKDYVKIPVNQQVEVLALSGNLTESAGSDPKIHAHVILGQRVACNCARKCSV